MNRFHYFLFIFIFSTTLFSYINAAGLFPIDDPMMDKSKFNADSRKPVWVPGSCAENEILYPSDNASKWVCDCKPAYIYHPNTGKCYMPFNQGPCKDGKYLILKKNKVVPQCAKNSCKNGEVKFKGQCHTYGTSIACNVKQFAYLEIDPISLRPKCIKKTKTPLLMAPITSATNARLLNLPKGAKEMYVNAVWCQKGSKRRIVGSC